MDEIRFKLKMVSLVLSGEKVAIAGLDKYDIGREYLAVSSSDSEPFAIIAIASRELYRWSHIISNLYLEMGFSSSLELRRALFKSGDVFASLDDLVWFSTFTIHYIMQTRTPVQTSPPSTESVS